MLHFHVRARANGTHTGNKLREREHARIGRRPTPDESGQHRVLRLNIVRMRRGGLVEDKKRSHSSPVEVEGREGLSAQSRALDWDMVGNMSRVYGMLTLHLRYNLSST